MREALPFEPHEASHQPTLAERAFRAKLKAELIKLRRVYDQAHLAGPSMGLQEQYSCLRHWFHSHTADIKTILAQADAPRNGIATWTLEGRSADRLYRLITPWCLNVDKGSEPSSWRRTLADLIRETAGQVSAKSKPAEGPTGGKTEGCVPTRTRKSKASLAPGTKSVLLDLS
jgi:hypothetical protein